MTVPNAIEIANGKQEANNKEFKGKTYKKASLSTSLTNLYVSKLNFAIEVNKNLTRPDLLVKTLEKRGLT